MNNVVLLQAILAALEKQNKLLEQQQLQRSGRLAQWREANPELSKKCHGVAVALGEAQTDLLKEIAEAVEDPNLTGFMFNEFVDKYGPRLFHLGNMMQVFSQLGTC